MNAGLVLIDKQEGISSAKAVAILKRKLNLKKVGHAGTLDPFATGLLVCLVGKSTKLAQVGLFGRKAYEGVFKFGVTTTTDDITGEVVAEKPCKIEIERLRDVVKEKFLGKISQVPPRVSAKHVNGERAYKLARQGVEFNLTPKECEIYNFEIVDRLSDTDFSFRVEVSGGTYIRALARDLGEIFESGGTLASLRRTKVGKLSVDEAVSLDDLQVSNIMSESILG